MKILICDDSALARKQLSDAVALYDSEIKVLESKDGKECIEIYRAESPDLVFIDIVMPVMDGVSAVKEILDVNPKAIVIIASSVGTKTEVMSAISAGASDFIQKPFSADQIKEVIKYYSNN